MKQTEKVLKFVTKAPEETEDRVLRFIGSDESVDRDNEKILVDGWVLTNYKKNPVVLVNHNFYDLPVAKTKKVWKDVENKRLMFDVQFATPEESSIGDTLYKLYKGGYMTSTSVSFRPYPDSIVYGDGEKQPRRVYTKQELLELSLVSIPANPNARKVEKGWSDAVENKVVDELEINELKSWLESLISEDEKLTEENLEQINKTPVHLCSCCGDELICVKCKGYIGSNDSDYLSEFFQDLDESEEKTNISGNSDENEYINELLDMLKESK
jgi:HK97 family phage prohead protease